jgi:hypothetical protein
MNHIGIQNAWKHLKQYINEQKKNQVKSPESITSNNTNENTNFVMKNNHVNDQNDLLNNIYGKDTWTNHHSLVTSQEDYKVGKFVKDVYFTMFPEKEGETYPSNWIIPVTDIYRQIRKSRALKLKSKLKDGMKGLKMHYIVGCILRCQLIHENVNIPLPILIQYMNRALSKSQEKKQKPKMTIELFETYRLDSKKGIKTYLKNVLPKCYNDLPPENLIEFTGYAILGLNRDDVFRAKRIARHSWNDGNGDFTDSTSPSVIAIAALFTLCIIKNKRIDYKMFGLSKLKLANAYKAIITSENPKVIKELDDNMKSPSKIMSPKTNTKSSVKY